jgi:hypothetical protein
MTQQKIRSLFGACVLVAVIALAAMTAASPYAGVYIDAGTGGGGTAMQSTAWSDLMSVIEACAAGSDCAVTVASGDQTFHWTPEGPLLALADGDVIVCEAAAPSGVAGGTHVADVTPAVGAHKLLP